MDPAMVPIVCMTSFVVLGYAKLLTSLNFPVFACYQVDSIRFYFSENQMTWLMYHDIIHIPNTS